MRMPKQLEQQKQQYAAYLRAIAHVESLHLTADTELPCAN